MLPVIKSTMYIISCAEMKDTLIELVVAFAMFISRKWEALCDISYPSSMTELEHTLRSSPSENADSDFNTESDPAFTNHCDAPVAAVEPANCTQ